MHAMKDKTMSCTIFKMTLSNSLMNYTSASILTRASLDTVKEITDRIKRNWQER